MKYTPTLMQSLIAVAAGGALVAPSIATADFTISGQVNRMVAQIDNGTDKELQHLDNTGSGTRIRLKGETDAGDGLMVGFYWETQYQSNRSNGVDASTVADIGDSFQPRMRNLYFKGGFGKITLGQGNGAANGITENEFTGTTYLTGYASPEDIWGGVTFGNGTSVSDVVDGMDALSRNDNLRYDSPKLGPVTLSADVGQGGKTEMAVRFATDIGEGKLKGGYGVWDRKDQVAGTAKGSAGSIAYLHGSGLNAALAIGSLDNGGAVDPENQMIILGYKTGDHSFSVRSGTTDDKTAGVSADSLGLGYVNRSIKSAELYAGYQTFESDEAGADDITILFGGARVKF